ncbi:UDP-glucose 4-epimerase [Microthyrium microscopicum]|uniref:UDP-glucose 4-epimerase n=1 Tax=Microthyrium microscopicum TaxID=703497 RepID=A0A6A6U3J5_9PEZI|nr:UDP-glucose 4-epimerase [Microthyrium microscopicum]
MSESRASSTSEMVGGQGTMDTPATRSSTLFDDNGVAPLSISQDESYILVVGGLGFIGSHTTLELLKEGYNVVVVDNLSNSYREVIDRVEFLASEYWQQNQKPRRTLKFHEADYKSPVMRSIISSYMTPAHLSIDGNQTCKIKGVIHFAAYKSVEESISQPIPYYLNNVCGMVNFLQLLQENGIQNFVFSSSATIYGTKANEGVALREEMCVHEPTTYTNSEGNQVTQEPGVFGLTSPYGRTKWMCEAILFDVAKSDPTWNITALRYFNPVGCHSSGLLGEDPRQKPTNLVPVVVRVLTGSKDQLEVFGTDYDTPDGTAVRDYIHVTDLARGHIAALAAAAKGRIKEPFRAFNLGSGRGYTVKEVVASLEKASSKKIPVVETGRRPGDVGFCIAGTDRAATELEWKTEKTLDECTVDVWNFTTNKTAKPGLV